MNNIYNRYIWLLHTVYQERIVTFERLCDIWKHHFLYNGKPLNVKRMETPGGVQKDKSVKFDKETGGFSFSDIRQERKRGLKM